jgi:type II secretory pathway component PulK
MDRSGRFRRILSAARRASGARPSAKGFTLILVLWVLAFLSVIAVTLIHQTREDARFERAMVEDAKAEALAEAGVVRAMAALSNPESDWLADGVAHQMRLGGSSPRSAG